MIFTGDKISDESKRELNEIGIFQNEKIENQWFNKDRNLYFYTDSKEPIFCSEIYIWIEEDGKSEIKELEERFNETKNQVAKILEILKKNGDIE